MSGNLQSKQWALWFVTAGRIFAGACFIIAGYLVVSDSPTSERAAGESSALRQASRLKESRSFTTRPIETIRVGDRVLAKNPEVSESERANGTEPDWASCLRLSLEMPLETEAGSQDPAILQIELLRPESWVRDHLAIVVDARQANAPRDAALAGGDGTASAGPTVDAVAPVPLSPWRPIFRDVALAAAALSAEGVEMIGLTLEMDLPEMGACGTAVITDLRSCPSVKQGDGHVVTATFAHPPSRQVLDVAFEGEPEPIGVTDNHLFWSVDREKFMAIGQMNLGERVQTYHGDTKRITGKLPRPGPQTVYNLEVYGEHVYFVGQQGLLAHNAYTTEIRGTEFEGTAWRHEFPERIGTTWTAGPWNIVAGHRYSKKGIAAVYGGLTKATARKEVEHYGAIAGRVATRRKVRLKNALDLRETVTRNALSVSLDDITSDSYTHSQRIGEWALRNGFDGIIAPSARFEGRANIVIFDGMK